MVDFEIDHAIDGQLAHLRQLKLPRRAALVVSGCSAALVEEGNQETPIAPHATELLDAGQLWEGARYAAPVPLRGDQLEGLDVLLDESVLLAVELDPERLLLGLTFYVEMIPADAERGTEDLYLQLLLHRVARLAVSLRSGASWSDPDSRVVQLEVGELPAALEQIRYHETIYGRRFLDVPERDSFSDWERLLSLDFRADGPAGSAHTLTVRNEELVIGRERDERVFFDLRAWFDDLSLRDRRERTTGLDEAIAASRRYWDAVLQRGSGGPSPYPVPRLQIPLPCSSVGR